ncbi:uncharacterized protein LOC144348235 [Saccoglossus kowalevskii]
MPIIDEPFHRVAIDLIGPISPISDKGNRYILVVVDFATRYLEAIALPKIETERVAEALLEIFCRVGFPTEILSDRRDTIYIRFNEGVPQSSTGFAPFELLYGHTVRDPMQLVKELWTEQETPEVRNTYQYVLDLCSRLKETCQLARDSLFEAQGKYKHHYDKRSKNRTFQVGQKVTLLLPTDHNKLLLQWKGLMRWYR